MRLVHLWVYGDGGTVDLHMIVTVCDLRESVTSEIKSKQVTTSTWPFLQSIHLYGPASML